jgi:hypothetical protein
VDLEWFDPDTDGALDVSARLAYERGAMDGDVH